MDEVEKHKYCCRTRATALTLAVMAQGETQVLLLNQGNGFELGSNGTGTNSGYMFQQINWSSSGTLRDALLYRHCLCQCVYFVRMRLLLILLVLFLELLQFLMLVWVVVVYSLVHKIIYDITWYLKIKYDISSLM